VSQAVNVVVDLSNVTRDAELGFSYDKAAWARWERLRSAWMRHHPEAKSFLLVADDTLRSKLSREDRVRYDQARRTGLLIECPVRETDETLLMRAVTDAASVLSCDGFTDHLRKPGVSELKVYQWSICKGEVAFTQRSMRRPLSLVESRRVDRQKRLEMGLTTDSPVLEHRWRCTQAACSEDLVVYPNVRRGDPTCPSCDAFLVDDGEWHSPVWIKLLVGEDTHEELLLEDGDELILGREDAPDVFNVSAVLDDREGSLISRRHLLLKNESGQIRAEDLNSTNGTTVASPIAGRRAWMPPAKWPVGRAAGVPLGARIRLGGTRAIIELSGRRIGRH
jgi:hypothetical protein